MTLEILSAVGGGAEPPNQNSAQSAEYINAIAQARVDGASGHAGRDRTETVNAVQPTPVSATASKADFAAPKAQQEAVFDYPVMGPDKFAKVASHNAIELADARNAAAELPEKEAIKAAEKAEAAPAPDAPEVEAKPEAPRDEVPTAIVQAESASEAPAEKETSVFVETPDD